MDYIIVQAGGKGTRMKELTRNKPKALVPVFNLPMLFHLFRKYPDKRFIIIADYKKEVLRAYLEAFAEVAYVVVDADGSGTCAGIAKAISLLPPEKPFMLLWSDLILPESFSLPKEYQEGQCPDNNYIGISENFSCRWSYENGVFTEQRSSDHGVAGLFLFTDKKWLLNVPEEGELVRWLKTRHLIWQTIGLSGTKEFGIYEEYQKQPTEKCRPFNRIMINGNVLTKEPIDEQGKILAKDESAWYQKAIEQGICALPEIYSIHPLKMEYINGDRIDEVNFCISEKKRILRKLIDSLKEMHRSKTVFADAFSLKEAYFYKTLARLSKIRDLVPYAKEPVITVNGKKCRNVFFHKLELENRLDQLMLNCKEFCFIHGDSTFSNLLLRENGEPVFIDPRGYFGHTKLYGDARYDWAKLYYSIVGNYDRFNIGDFQLWIDMDKFAEVTLTIESNGWEDMEEMFFCLTGADVQEIKLLHAVIWLSLTTYAWQDYDKICGAFYNGLYYLEDVL